MKEEPVSEIAREEPSHLSKTNAADVTHSMYQTNQNIDRHGDLTGNLSTLEAELTKIFKPHTSLNDVISNPQNRDKDLDRRMILAVKSWLIESGHLHVEEVTLGNSKNTVYHNNGEMAAEFDGIIFAINPVSSDFICCNVEANQSVNTEIIDQFLAKVQLSSEIVSSTDDLPSHLPTTLQADIIRWRELRSTAIETKLFIGGPNMKDYENYARNHNIAILLPTDSDYSVAL